MDNRCLKHNRANCQGKDGCLSNCKNPNGKKKSTTTTITTTTTTTKNKRTETTTTEQPPEKTWSVTIYSGKNCDADNGDYMLVEGYTSGWSECVGMQQNFNSDMGSGKTSCRLFTEGGFEWTTCDHSDMYKPKSWYLNSGNCMVYSDDHCKESSGTIIPFKDGCATKSSYPIAPDKFGSIKCSGAS